MLPPNWVPKAQVFLPNPGSIRRGWERFCDWLLGLSGEACSLEQFILDRLAEPLDVRIHVFIEENFCSCGEKGCEQRFLTLLEQVCLARTKLSRWELAQLRQHCEKVVQAIHHEREIEVAMSSLSEESASCTNAGRIQRELHLNRLEQQRYGAAVGRKVEEFVLVLFVQRFGVVLTEGDIRGALSAP